MSIPEKYVADSVIIFGQNETNSDIQIQDQFKF